MRAITVRVPASAANLGPGYDAFGLALGLHARFTAEPAEEWSVRVLGEGAGELPAAADNPVAAAMSRVFAEAGEPGRAAKLFCHSRIPLGRGLGSSAAAIAGGCVLADAMLGSPLGRDRLFRIAAHLEGHADNVAAAIHGGFTISWRDDDDFACSSLRPCGLCALVLVAEAGQPTTEARAALPASVPHADAAFNAGRAGLVTAGLLLGRGDLLRAGAADRLHQPYRAGAGAAEEARGLLLAAGADGAVLSGAGPSVLGLFVGESDADARARAGEAVARLRDLPEGWRAPLVLPVDRDGAVVEDG